MIQNSIQELTKKEMSRKEFIALTGLGVASLMGVSNIIRLLGNKQKAANSSGSGGYGRGAAYGRD